MKLGLRAKSTMITHIWLALTHKAEFHLIMEFDYAITEAHLALLDGLQFIRFQPLVALSAK